MALNTVLATNSKRYQERQAFRDRRLRLLSFQCLTAIVPVGSSCVKKINHRERKKPPSCTQEKSKIKVVNGKGFFPARLADNLPICHVWD